MPQFSTNESVSLEKEIDLNKQKIVDTRKDDLEAVYEINRCGEWIRSNEFNKVCLQFPDHLLPDSTEIALELEALLDQNIYILGDTAYESCCIDYIAAAHINADAIIHYGPTCFSKTSANIPHLNIYEKHFLNLENFETSYNKNFKMNIADVVIILDSEYFHKFDEIAHIFKKCDNVEIKKIDQDDLKLDNCTIIVISSNDRKILNFKLNHHVNQMYLFNPKNSSEIVPYEIDPKVLKRRYFLIEKIKDSRTIGIVIGTLGVRNYLKVIERVKMLAKLRGKKYYLISVGKPTVAKLANFPEVDIYVMITCSLNEIYDSREFYKPIVTPYDVELALNPSASEKEIKFSYDYNYYLSNLENIDMAQVIENETDVSLLSNSLRSNIPDQIKTEDFSSTDNQVALKTEGTLALNKNFGAGFLAERSWKGLEQNLTQTEVKLAEKGRKGIAGGYENEPE